MANMIIIFGDSNYRDMLDAHGERLSKAVKEKITFFLNTSNESLKSQLEKLDYAPKIILVAAPLNEIAHRVKIGGKKGRDETIKIVMEEQNKIVTASANVDGRLGTIHLLVPPFLRQDPPWFEERLKLSQWHMGNFIVENSPWNVGIGNAVQITASDLKEDKVHLTEAGLEKLYQVIKADLKKCKENLGEGDNPLSQDWASQIVDEPAKVPPTPSTMRKRTRARSSSADDDDDDEVALSQRKIKKVKKVNSEDKMDMIYKLVKEMKEESKMARDEVGELKTKVTTSDKKVDELKVEFDNFKQQGPDGGLTAEMREDIDGLENENLRSIVIIRKLKAETAVPKDKKLLRTYVQDLSRILATKILGPGSGSGVKYAATLYAFVDPSKKDNKEGLVPPFKICFTTKDQAVRFRDKAVKMTKANKPRARTYGEGEQNMEQGDDWDEANNPSG